MKKIIRTFLLALVAMLVIPNIVSADGINIQEDHGTLRWESLGDDVTYKIKVAEGLGDFEDVGTTDFYVIGASEYITKYCEEHTCSLDNHDFGIMVYTGSSNAPTYQDAVYVKAYLAEYVDVDLSIDRNTLTKSYYPDMDKTVIGTEWVAKGDTACKYCMYGSTDDIHTQGSDYKLDYFSYWDSDEQEVIENTNFNGVAIETNTMFFANWHKKYLSLEFVNTRGVSLDDNEGVSEGYNADNYLKYLPVRPNGDLSFYDSGSVARIRIYNYSTVGYTSDDYYYDCLYRNYQEYWQAGECMINDYSNDPEATDAFEYGWNYTYDFVEKNDNFNGIWIKPKSGLAPGWYGAVVAIELHDSETDTWKTTHAIDVDFAVQSTVTFDYNGATNSNGQGYKTELYYVNSGISTTREELLDGLTLPTSKDLDYILVDDQRVELGTVIYPEKSLTIKYVWKTISAVQEDVKYTVVYDYNGETCNGLATETADYKPGTKINASKSNMLTDMTLPAGKDLDYILVDGHRVELGTTITIDGNMTIKYMWKTISTTLVEERATTSTATISWNKNPDAKGYFVYRKSGSKWKKVATIKNVNTTTYTNKKLKAGTNYTYKISAYTTYKKKKKTKYTTISTTDPVTVLTAPAAPKASIKGSTFDSVKVGYKGVKGTYKYEIFRSTSKKGAYEKVGESTTTSYTDTGLKTGTTYYYKVRACNNNCGGFSKVVSKKPSLAKPGLSVSSPEAGKVLVRPTTVAGEDGYVIQFSTKKNKGFKEVANLDVYTTEYLEEGFKSKKTFYFRVRAYRVVDGVPVYSAWSKVKKVKIK